MVDARHGRARSGHSAVTATVEDGARARGRLAVWPGSGNARKPKPPPNQRCKARKFRNSYVQSRLTFHGRSKIFDPRSRTAGVSPLCRPDDRARARRRADGAKFCREYSAARAWRLRLSWFRPHRYRAASVVLPGLLDPGLAVGYRHRLSEDLPLHRDRAVVGSPRHRLQLRRQRGNGLRRTGVVGRR